MGFNNDGAAAVAPRLKSARAALQRQHPGVRPVIGVNIGKSKVVGLEDAVSDYLISARSLAPAADYLVVNVSSPNTPGLRLLQDVETLRPLLTAVGEEADKAAGRHVPLLVKIAPDLSDEDIDDVARLALDLKLDGIIATNTTIARTGLASSPDKVEACGAGGLSGAPLKKRSLEVLARLKSVTGGALTLVSVGGVETAQDVQERPPAEPDPSRWAASKRHRTSRHGWTPAPPSSRATRRSFTRDPSGPPASTGCWPRTRAGARLTGDRARTVAQPRSPRQMTAGGFSLKNVEGMSGGELAAADLGLGQAQAAELQGAHGAVPDGAALDVAELFAEPLLELAGEDEDVHEDREEHDPEGAQDVDHLLRWRPARAAR